MTVRKIINKQLGEVLIEQGALNRSQLNEALAFQEKRGGLIGEILVELGFVKEEEIVHALSIQYGFPYLPLANYNINPEIITIIPSRVARQYLLIPVDRVGNNLTIAMSNPLNTHAIEDLELSSGCSIQIFVSTLSDVKWAIEKYYKDKD